MKNPNAKTKKLIEATEDLMKKVNAYFSFKGERYDAEHRMTPEFLQVVRDVGSAEANAITAIVAAGGGQ